MHSIIVEHSINGRPSIFSIEIKHGFLELHGKAGERFSIGCVLRDNVAYTEALSSYLTDPKEIIPLLKPSVKVIGG